MHAQYCICSKCTIKEIFECKNLLKSLFMAPVQGLLFQIPLALRKTSWLTALVKMIYTHNRMQRICD